MYRDYQLFLQDNGNPTNGLEFEWIYIGALNDGPEYFFQNKTINPEVL